MQIRRLERRIAMLLSLPVMFALSAAAKSERTYYDAATMERVRKAVASQEWAANDVADAKRSAEWFLEKSDDDLWDLVPPPGQMRAINVSFGNGCPEHGKRIFREGGHYPWKISRDHPFKVECPVGGETYPSNDVTQWHPDSNTAEPHRGTPITDTGAGWVDEDGKRYFFVAYWTFWQRWRKDIIGGVRSLSNAYLLTGDDAYAHAGAILLARVAGYYAEFDYAEQSYHSGKFNIRGRICDRIWENGTIANLTLAYDGIFPIFEKDPELRAFLAGKGIDDPARHIEQEMLCVMADDVMRGFIQGNTGMYQRSLAYLAIVLANDDPEYGPTTRQMREWIMTGPGNVEYLLWNDFFRDGHGGESSPSYSCGWCRNFYTIAEMLPRLGVDIWAEPKVRKMADIGLDLAVGGTRTPSIGDSGNILGQGRVCWSPALQGRAFDRYRDPRHAAALREMDAESRQLWNPLFDEQELATVLEQRNRTLTFPTRNVGGYGLAILESGKDPNRRGAWMYYGYAGGGHGHFDRLTIGMHAFGRPMLTEMGYPAHWGHKANYWTKNTVSHYCVVVDQHRQESMNRGFLNTVASAPGLQLMDAEASHAAYPSCTTMYRRTAALVDLDPARSYLLDIFRVRGGNRHDYSFHGPPFAEFTVSGLTPVPRQKEGTLLGRDVPFGSDEMPADLRAAGGNLMLQLAEGSGLVTDDRDYRERSREGWATYRRGAILTRLTDAVVRLPMPDVDAPKVKLVLKVHNYQDGRNRLEAMLGTARRDLAYGPEDDRITWLSAIFDVTGDGTHLELRATHVEQPFALILEAGLTTDLDSSPEQFYDVRTSGYQYLYDVRRGQPDEGWSATWRDPESDTALTMTVPRGAMQTVILAKAEAELKPNHPDSLDYVIGRNDKGPGEENLDSDYIVVAEPHRGKRAVQAVDRLESIGDPGDALGILVQTATGRDIIHSSLHAEATCEWQLPGGTMTATGEFAMLRLDDQGLRYACLVNGTRLRFGDVDLQCDPSPAGFVRAVNFDTNTVTVDTTIPEPETYLNRVAILGNDRHRTSYTIEDIRADGSTTTLGFGDVRFLVQMGPVEEIDSEARTVKLGKLGRVDGRMHQGRWLCNEDRSVLLKITACKGDVMTVETGGRDLKQVFTDVDGDGRTLYWISDIGPGDSCRVPAVCSVRR